MDMRSLVLVSAAVSALAGTAFPRAAEQEAAVPITKEPRHRVVFESDIVRVHDVQVPPGDTTLFHVHDTPILYVPISRSRTRSQPLGGEWSGGDASQPTTAAAGPARVTSTISYVDTPVTHRVNNVGDTLFRLIAIVNRSAGEAAGMDDGSAVAGKPELTNRYYRAYRVELPAGQGTGSHAHAAPVVIVQQTSGHASTDGSTKSELREPGAFALHQGPGMHSVKNEGASAMTVIEIELRGTASWRAPL